jgi:hypothetical protein
MFVLSNVLYAQDWKREVMTNRWGDTDGFAYHQGPLSGTAYGDKNVSVSVFFVWNPPDSSFSNVLVIYSKTTGNLTWHPAYSFMDETIKFSLRNAGGEKSFQGFTYANSSSYDNVGMYVMDQALINLLHGSGQWDVLIEGDDWYIRTTIRGGLPSN